jgi:hypothetical protein
LREDRGLRGREAHVEGEDELAATSTRSALDDGDRDLVHRAVALGHLREAAQPLAALGLRISAPDEAVEIGVGDEELRIGAVEEDDAHVGVHGKGVAQVIEVLEQRCVE